METIQSEGNMKNKDSTVNLLIELFFVLALVLVCFKLSYGISNVMDIRLYDESAYLKHGYQLSSNQLFRDGFIYLTWYKILSFFVRDTVNLYYFNYILLISINSFLIYILLRKMKKGMFISAVSSILFLISDVNITGWPFITRFALALILCTFILILSVKNKKTKYLIALIGLSLLIYTRPEYILSLMIFSAAAIIFLLYKFIKSHKRVFLVFALLTLILSTFILFVKNPSSARRSLIAFGQHYGVHLYIRGKISVDPSLNWEKIMKENFGTNQSIMKAFLNNPGEMVNHVSRNLKKLSSDSYLLFFPYKTPNNIIKKIIFVFAGLLFILLMIIAVKKKKKPFLHGDNIDDVLFYFLSILIITPLIISVCFIFPRAHYLLVLFAVLLIMAAKNLPVFPDKSKLRWVPYLIILFVLYWVPWQASGSSGLFPRHIKSIHNKRCSNLNKIKFIRNIKVKSKIVFLGYGGNMDPYINNFEQLKSHRKNVPFNEYIEREKVNMIMVDSDLIKDPRFKSDDEFKSFISKVPGNNWVRVAMPGCEASLFSRKEILEQVPPTPPGESFEHEGKL